MKKNIKHIFILFIYICFSSIIIKVNVHSSENRQSLKALIMPIFNKNQNKKFDYLSDLIQNTIKINLTNTNRFIFPDPDEVNTMVEKFGSLNQSQYKYIQVDHLAKILDCSLLLTGQFTITDDNILIEIEVRDIYNEQIILNIKKNGGTGIDILRIIDDVSREVAVNINADDLIKRNSGENKKNKITDFKIKKLPFRRQHWYPVGEDGKTNMGYFYFFNSKLYFSDKEEEKTFGKKFSSKDLIINSYQNKIDNIEMTNMVIMHQYYKNGLGSSIGLGILGLTGIASGLAVFFTGLYLFREQELYKMGFITDSAYLYDPFCIGGILTMSFFGFVLLLISLTIPTCVYSYKEYTKRKNKVIKILNGELTSFKIKNCEIGVRISLSFSN